MGRPCVRSSCRCAAVGSDGLGPASGRRAAAAAFYSGLGVVGVLMGGLGAWWRSRVLARQRQRYAAADLEAAWRALPLLAGLDAGQSGRLADLALLFLQEKRLEPVQELILTDRMRFIIALQACLPILELGLEWYRGWYAMILYPAEFVPGHEYVDADGLVWVDDAVKSGEAWERGPVILSWADVEAGMELDGYNVIVHELAHKLDMRDGNANGCPPLHAAMSRQAWSRDLATAFADLGRRAGAGEDTPIDPYGAESPAEFFAVASEAFFETPEVLMDEYPAVYDQLRAFYRQDPLRRFEGRAANCGAAALVADGRKNKTRIP
jgi:MtfA peptidase